MAKPYPKEVSDYIVKNYDRLNAEEIAYYITDVLLYNITSRSVYTWASKHHLSKKAEYSDEEIQFIVENAFNYTNSVEFAKEYNKRFPKRTAGALKAEINKLLPDKKYGWSGGKKVGEGSSSTAKPIGSETFKGGYWWIKIDNQPLSKRYTSKDRYKNWKQKHVYMYEKVYGKSEKDDVIVFLDQDVNNCTLENLYRCKRHILNMMRRNNWWTDSREHNLTAIMLCELTDMIKMNEVD